jgi:exodeoxyribonuclease VII large subunit
VGALLLAATDALAARFGAVAVQGEVSGFSRAASGHCYFSLKDMSGAPATLRCAMFRRAAALLDFSPADGQHVQLRGRLAVFEARGELQLVVESMQRLGAGSLYEEFLRRRAHLAAQGLFDSARKRPLPAWPLALGVVTSLAAAALHDVLATLARRAPHVRVVLYPCLVQGVDAPTQLVAALQAAGQRREVDALLLVRGGGALEDLWAFNDEQVVRAVAACPLPVVCGVGHETDVTLCDLAADLRAPTPTAAAELAAPARTDAWAALDDRWATLQRSVEAQLHRGGQRLDMLALRLNQPASVLRAQLQRLEATAGRLRRAVAGGLDRGARAPAVLAARLHRAARAELRAHTLGLAAVAEHLQAHDPRKVLRRGYAWVESNEGRPITSVLGLAPGDCVRAVWADGRAETEVVTVEPLPPAA